MRILVIITIASGLTLSMPGAIAEPVHVLCESDENDMYPDEYVIDLESGSVSQVDVQGRPSLTGYPTKATVTADAIEWNRNPGSSYPAEHYVFDRNIGRLKITAPDIANSGHSDLLTCKKVRRVL